MIVELDMSDECIDALLIKSLEGFIEAELSSTTLPMYSWDEKEEKKKIKKLKKAFKIVAGWYGSEKYKDYEELLK